MKRIQILTLALMLLMLLIAAGCSIPLGLVPKVSSGALPKASAPQSGALADLQSAYEKIYAQVNPSVVLIDVVEQASSTSPNLPPGHPVNPQQPGQAALGSGFVWDTQGDIVTNNHVIAGVTRITVTFADGTVVPGKLVAADPDSDLAVVKVDVPTSQLHPVELADSTQLQVGQIVVAIGNPYGEQNTMTTGIISALGRSLPAENSALQGAFYTIPDVIQTDASINPGNSGGVLLNADGQVIGVTNQIESQSGSSAGVGFAIPSAIVQKVVPALIKTGHFDHPYIGVGGATLTPGQAQAMGLPASQRGALIGTVTRGSPADKAGLQASTKQATIDGSSTLVGGDVITAMDGQPMKSFDDIVAYLARSTEVNQVVTLTILRDGKEQNVKLTLGTRPSQ